MQRQGGSQLLFIKRMCKLNKKSGNKRIDPKLDVRASCCGHGKYPMTIVCHIKPANYFLELISQQAIQRKIRFYKRDKEGYFYIPETL